MEAEARSNRAVIPEEVNRAEASVRSQWAEIDKRKKDREDLEAIELQDIRVEGYGTIDPVAEPEEVYRHPRMDWK